MVNRLQSGGPLSRERAGFTRRFLFAALGALAFLRCAKPAQPAPKPKWVLLSGHTRYVRGEAGLGFGRDPTVASLGASEFIADLPYIELPALRRMEIETADLMLDNGDWVLLEPIQIPRYKPSIWKIEGEVG